MVGGDCISKELISQPPKPSVWPDGKFKGGTEGSLVTSDPVSLPSRMDGRYSEHRARLVGRSPGFHVMGSTGPLRERASQPVSATPGYQVSNSVVGAARVQCGIWGKAHVTHQV